MTLIWELAEGSPYGYDCTLWVVWTVTEKVEKKHALQVSTGHHISILPLEQDLLSVGVNSALFQLCYLGKLLYLSKRQSPHLH